MDPEIRRAVIFKSRPEFYNKEKRGFKPNTSRIEEDLTERDERFIILDDWQPEDMLYITIENTDTAETFTRLITDVSFFNYLKQGIKLYIISWKHEP
jgi:hypothetical protein